MKVDLRPSYMKISKTSIFGIIFGDDGLPPGPNKLGLDITFPDGSNGIIGFYEFEKMLWKLCKKHGVILPPKEV